jgi:hypothetical protein
MGSYLFYPAYFELVKIVIVGVVVLSVFLPFLLAIVGYSERFVLLVLCLYREMSYTRQ